MLSQCNPITPIESCLLNGSILKEEFKAIINVTGMDVMTDNELTKVISK
jgi:hypothetical protein